MLTGSQVEFLSFDKRVAKSIYIINENLNVSSILSADSISSARLKALWGIGLLIFGFIPYIGYFFIPNIRKIINIGLEFFSFIPYIVDIVLITPIVGLVLYSMAIYSVSKAVASKSLFKNYIKAMIIIFLCSFLMPSMSALASKHVDIFTRMIAVFVLDMIALIVAIYFYRIHAELARLSGSSLFLWSFWIFVVSVPLLFLFILSLGFAFFFFIPGFAGLIMSCMLLFVAWWRFGKVEKR